MLYRRTKKVSNAIKLTGVLFSHVFYYCETYQQGSVYMHHLGNLLVENLSRVQLPINYRLHILTPKFSPRSVVARKNNPDGLQYGPKMRGMPTSGTNSRARELGNSGESRS
jgi:hypothetical protein